MPQIQVSFFFFLAVLDSNSGPVLVRQVLYHLSHTLLFSFFSNRFSCFCWGDLEPPIYASHVAWYSLPHLVLLVENGSVTDFLHELALNCNLSYFHLSST
jgi:hypothetical protein